MSRLRAFENVEIGDINVATGESNFNLVATNDLPDNAKIMTKKGDLLVSTVRPYRGAVSITSFDDLLVSGAFTVLRSKGTYPVQTLQVLFRTCLYKEWLLKFNVGTSYPVIKDDDVLDIPIPRFDEKTHEAIEESINKVRLLLRQSEKLFDYTKQAIEIAIEKDEETATKYLDSI